MLGPDENYNLELLESIVKKKMESLNMELPLANDLIIHLRVGDVIDWNEYSVNRMANSFFFLIYT